MPLLEALLTEGSTAAKFDARMNGLGPNTRVHLGPSSRDAYGVVIPFQTKGYAYNVSGGWQIKPGMKIIGSGMEVTTLQLVNHTAGESYSAIGHDISAGVTADFSEVSDLTIDCKLSQDGAETAPSIANCLKTERRPLPARCG